MAQQAQFRSDIGEQQADMAEQDKPELRENAVQAANPSASMTMAEASINRPSETYKKNHKFLTEKLRGIASEFIPFGEPNKLKDRFEIMLDKELPQFSKKYVKAYAALDHAMGGREVIAYLCEPYHPHRQDALPLLVGMAHPHLMELLDYGIVYLPALQANRLMIVYNKPEGETLQAKLERGEYYKLSDAMRHIIIPVTSALQRLAGLGLHHGSICPATIYITQDQKIILGDYLAEPAGCLLPDRYEPLEYLLALPEGRGGGNLSADIYALAVLVLEACDELGNRKQLSREQLIGLYLTRGCYHTLVNESGLTSQLLDLMRGALQDKSYDRWGIEHLVQFASGKRYNLIPPNYPRDAARAYDFAGTDHYTLAHLAHSYHKHWDNVLNDAKERNLTKWFDSLSFKSTIKERMERVQTRISRTATKGAAADELITRAILTLDTQGPIRLKHVAVHGDGLAHLFNCITQQGDLQQQVLFQEIIKNELAGFWQEGDGEHYRSLDFDAALLRQLSEIKSVGFGMERVLYELNPHMPCMSRDYLPYYATNAKTMLLVLEHLATQRSDRSLLDRHLIAFLAARCNIRKEIKLNDYKNYPELHNNREFQALVILARAQEKVKLAALPALTCWAAFRVIEMIEQFNSREIRQSFSQDLQTVVPRGKIAYVVQIMQNKDYLTKDYAGYLRANKLYHKNEIKITKLRDKKAIWQRAQQSGLKTAFLISIAILFGVSYYLLAKYAL